MFMDERGKGFVAKERRNDVKGMSMGSLGCVEGIGVSRALGQALWVTRKKGKLEASGSVKSHEGWMVRSTMSVAVLGVMAIQSWLYNHSQDHTQKALLTYDRAWITRTMIMHQQKKDIKMVLEKAGIKQVLNK
ncbi:hypothetical protein V8B97DRAFT_1921049 [Scleroderma yunnanense]